MPPPTPALAHSDSQSHSSPPLPLAATPTSERACSDSPDPQPCPSSPRTLTATQSLSPEVGDDTRLVTPTIPAINATSQSTGMTSPLDAGVRREHPPDGPFTFEGSSPFITPAALSYLQTIPAGQRWVDMVTSFLCLEELPIVKGVSSTVFISPNTDTSPPSPPCVSPQPNHGQTKCPHWGRGVIYPVGTL